MRLTNILEVFFIFLLPLIPFFVWWILDTSASATTLLMLILVLQSVVALSLFFLKKKENALIQDLQDQRKHTAYEQFISLYERSPIPYLTIDQNGEILMFNPTTIKLLNTTQDELLGLNFVDMIVGDGESDELSIIAGKIHSGVTIKDQEMKIKTMTGDIRWVSMTVHIYDIKDQRVVSLVDITEDKLVDTAKSEFVALATHQLRTPISAIRWNLELLEKNLQSTKTEDQERYLAKLKRNTMKMIALINDFLSVSKLETGTFATNVEQIDLTNFCESVIDEFTEKITDKKINLKRNYLPSNLKLDTDTGLFHIIVSNLLSNAVKYVEAGGEISFDYELIGDTLIINIADNGIGIPKNELDKLFTKFFRASNAQSHQTEGTGLGLYIVKQAVEKLGGVIEVVSGQGAGAKFTVKLPY